MKIIEDALSADRRIGRIRYAELSDAVGFCCDWPSKLRPQKVSPLELRSPARLEAIVARRRTEYVGLNSCRRI